MHHKLLFALICFLPFMACNPDHEHTGDNFDRTAMLQNMADKLIRPAFSSLQQQTTALNTAATAFTSAPSVSQLAQVREAWVSAYSAWQSANAFNFGPAGEEGLQKSLVEETGTFPVSETKINAAIASGQWSQTNSDRDARGFLAVEYLLYGKGLDDAALVALFQSETNRSALLTALTGNLVSRINVVNDAWNGAYHTEFVGNNGTDSGSSTSHLYNEFVRSYESVKNLKVGLPLGKQAGQTSSEPALVEAYYSGLSLSFLKKHLAAIENIWYGRSTDGSDGPGFREYLEAVEGGNALITNTENQLTAVHAALEAVPGTPAMSEQITGNATSLEALHTELQKLTRYFKSDLSSLLGIAITFSSNDGD